MKTKELNKKIKLNKTTIANLSDVQMNHLRGGGITVKFSNCTCYHTDLDENCPRTSVDQRLCDTEGEICC